MKFGRTLRENILKEWRFYTVDYKALKKVLKSANKGEDDAEISDTEAENEKNEDIDVDAFFNILENSKEKLTRFYFDREAWALEYMNTLEERVQKLRDSTSSPPSPSSERDDARVSTSSTRSSSASISSVSGTLEVDDKDNATETPSGSSSLSAGSYKKIDFTAKDGMGQMRSAPNSSWLKEEYKRVGLSKHFHNFIYAKKSLATFERELDLLLEFLELNETGFSKILKKFDKRTGSAIREEKMEELRMTHSFMSGETLRNLKEKVTNMIDEVNTLKPTLPEGWEERKVYTIGCFDLFHRGHQNVLLSLREFGYYVVAGIHDDQSYFQLKNKYPIENLETRMENVKPFVDQIFVIPSTDPLIYIKNMVSQQDIETGSCCYARGDDMLNFPGREWVETVMPVHFVPRTEACSSTLIRTIYHADDEGLRKKAAFAKTRYDGKPVDDQGNVLKLSVTKAEQPAT